MASIPILSGGFVASFLGTGDRMGTGVAEWLFISSSVLGPLPSGIPFSATRSMARSIGIRTTPALRSTQP